MACPDRNEINETTINVVDVCAKNVLIEKIASIMVFVFSEEIIALFRDDIKVIEIGAFTLRAYCIAFPLNSIIIMCNMLFQSTGNTLSASLMAASRQGLFLIPSIFILNYFFGLTGLQCAQCVSDYCSFVIAIPLIINYFKKLR